MRFFVHGNPLPQPRPRGRVVSPKFGRPFVHFYDDGSADAWKNSVRVAILNVWRNQSIIDGAIKLTVKFYISRPKSHFGTGRNAGILKMSAPSIVDKKPDLDNYIKATMDAITDTGRVWHDDGQVASLGDSCKLYATDTNPTGAEIEIEPMEETR